MFSLLYRFSFRGFLIIALICVCARQLRAQNPYSRKEVIIPSALVTSISAIRTLDGGSMRLLESQDSIQPFRHLTLLKLSNTGGVSWYKYLGSTYSSQPANIVQSPDSGYFVCCIGGTTSYTMFKTDKNGGIVFSNRINLPAGYSIYSLAQVKAKNNGGFYVAASIIDGINSIELWHLFEVSANGTIVSSDGYNMVSGKNRVYAIDTCSNGDVLLAGSLWSPTFAHSPVVTRIDTSGTIIWSKTFTSALNVIPYHLIRSNGDLIYVLGQSSGAAGAQTVLMKLDGNGNELWSMNYSAASTVLAPCTMHRTATGDIMITGESLFIKTDSAGVPLCARQYPGTTFFSIVELSPQVYQLAGLSYQHTGGIIQTVDSCGQTCGDTTLAVVKTPYSVSDSNLTGSIPLPVTSQPISIPEDLTTIHFLEPCSVTGIAEAEQKSFIRLYPNPASQTVTVNAAEQIETISIIDVNGRCVRRDPVRANSCQLNIPDLPAGLYLLYIEFENHVESRRLVIE